MLDQTSQWYKLQYPECFVDEEARLMQKTLADFVDKEIIPVRDKIDDEAVLSYSVPLPPEKMAIDKAGVLPTVRYGGRYRTRTCDPLRVKQVL